jgi:hypothetical protein
MVVDAVAQRFQPLDPHGDLFTDAAIQHQAKLFPEIQFGKVETEEDLRDCFRLRGDAAIRQGWLKPSDLADGLETDRYDRDATHVAAWKGKKIVATARLVFPAKGRLLPTESDFNILLRYQQQSLEVGRVAIAPEASDPEHRVLLGLLGEIWNQAEGRFLWIGANEAGVITLYRRLGAVPEYLTSYRPHGGTLRRAVRWDMHQFAPSYHKRAFA